MTQATGSGPLRDPLRDPIPVRRALEAPERRPRITSRVYGWAQSTPLLAELTVVLVAIGVFSYRIGRPSPWWDEAVTRDVISRPASSIVDLAGNVDLVHTAYYLLVHALVGPNAGYTAIRLVSMVAATATVIALMVLGRELGSRRTGLFAGVIFAIAPLSTRYAQEARPYAMVALAATLSTLALVRLCRRPWLPLRWALYVVSLVAVGLLNVLALLMFLPHLVYVVSSSSKAVRRRWYAAAAGGIVLLSPMLYASSTQREQVSWLPKPDFWELTGFLNAQYGTWTVAGALLVLAIVGLVVGTARRTHAPALGLGLAWALIPPVVLWAVSQVHPLYDWRYVFFTMPGSALALASAATFVRTRVMIAAVLVLTLFGLHMQTVYRYAASGHAENLRGAAEAIRDNAEPGDAIIFLPETRRVVELGYPEDFSAVDDIALAKTGAQSATLFGVEEPIADLAEELKHRNRVWVITGSERYGEEPTAAETAKEHLIYDHYRLAGVALSGRYEVRLYERSRTVTSPGISTSTTQQTR